MTGSSGHSLQTLGQVDAPGFDGIICFGGVDWWYHNRGHYDLQMMRELSARVPILYVNSIGMRTPKISEGAMFAKRVLRKLGSIGHGLVEVRPNFNVLSPLVLPGVGGAGPAMKRLLAHQVRSAARRCGIRRPLLWIACPPAAGLIDAIDPVAVVYQRTDRFESFSGVNVEQIVGFDKMLKQRADLVLFCARNLYEAEGADCRRSAFVDHGVDFDLFSQAGIRFDDHGAQPTDLQGLARPRVGFVGGIDSHTFDPRLFLEVARRLTHVQFVLIGSCSLPRGWCELPNVHLLGQRPYDEVAGYMAACDVLIMPWNQSDWIEACNPVKLKEYLAVGRPIVSTPFPELAHYGEHVLQARTGAQFAAGIVRSLAAPPAAAFQRERVASQGWRVKAREAWMAIVDSDGLATDASRLPLPANVFSFPGAGQ